MVDTEHLLVLAMIQKTFGKEGELLVKLHPMAPDTVVSSLNTQEPVFILMDEIPVPFYFASLQFKGSDKMVVRFEDFLSENLAADLVGRTVFYVPKKKKSVERNLTEAEMWEELMLDPSLLVGYTFTANGTFTGTVSDAFDYPNNPCIQLTFNGERTDTVLLPCRPNFITDIRQKKKMLTLTLPEGL